MIIKVRINSASKQQGGIDAIHGQIVDKDGNALPNTNISISAPRTLGLNLVNGIETDQVLDVAISVSPVQPAAAKKA